MRSAVVFYFGLILTFANAGLTRIPSHNEDNIGITEEARQIAVAVAGTSIQRPAAPSPYYGWNECYSCINCPKTYYNTTVKHCGDPPVKCVVYSQKYKYFPYIIYVRGCANDRGSCEEISNSHDENSSIMTLLSCLECTGNKCNSNSATKSFSSLTSAIFLVFTPILMKYAMS
ncbi:hypothetical protein ACJJTC_005896 [Scirpophaga incertulas]